MKKGDELVHFVSNLIERVEKTVSMILMFCMAVIIIGAVLFRYFLNNPVFWAGEVSIFLMIWISFLGGSLGLKNKSQAAVSILVERLPQALQKTLNIIVHILMLGFLLVLIYYSYQWLLSSNVAFQKSTALRMPMWIAYISVPIGLTFSFIHLISNLIGIVQGGEAE